MKKGKILNNTDSGERGCELPASEQRKGRPGTIDGWREGGKRSRKDGVRILGHHRGQTKGPTRKKSVRK